MVRLRADALRTHGRIRDDQPGEPVGELSADGALLTMQHGAEYENIFACWDWRRIPGTTAYDDGAPIKCSDDADEKAEPLPVGRRSGRRRPALRRWSCGATASGPSNRTSCSKRSSWRWAPGIRNDAPPRSSSRRWNRTGCAARSSQEPPAAGSAFRRSDRPGAVSGRERCSGFTTTDAAISCSTDRRCGSTASNTANGDPIDPFYRDRADSADLQMLGGAPLRHGRQLCLCDPALPECEADSAHGSQTPGGAPAQRRRLPGREIRPRTVCAVFRRPGSVGAEG